MLTQKILKTTLVLLMIVGIVVSLVNFSTPLLAQRELPEGGSDTGGAGIDADGTGYYGQIDPDNGFCYPANPVDCWRRF